MKYKVNITNCHLLIDNLYDLTKRPIIREGSEIYFLANSEEEASLIRTLNYHQRKSRDTYIKIQNIISK